MMDLGLIGTEWPPPLATPGARVTSQRVGVTVTPRPRGSVNSANSFEKDDPKATSAAVAPVTTDKETTADLIREVSTLEANLPLTLLPGFLQMVPFVGCVCALILFAMPESGQMPIHFIFACSALAYFLALSRSIDAARYCAHVTASTVPILDLALLLWATPPTIAQLDAFFALRDVAALVSLCVGMVLGWHGLPAAVIRVHTAMGLGWTSVWWRVGDVRPLTMFVPICLAPSLLGYGISHFATVARTSDEKLKILGERLEDVRRREIQREHLSHIHTHRERAELHRERREFQRGELRWRGAAIAAAEAAAEAAAAAALPELGLYATLAQENVNQMDQCALYGYTKEQLLAMLDDQEFVKKHNVDPRISPENFALWQAFQKKYPRLARCKSL